MECPVTKTESFDAIRQSLELEEIGLEDLPAEAIDYLRTYEAGDTDGMTAQRYGAERRAGSSIEGRGLFATEDILLGRVIAIKPGRIVDSQTIKENTAIIQHSHQQIDEDRFLAGLTRDEVNKNLVGYNHSCDPSSRVVVVEGVPLAFVVARRNIKKGEEITADYSVSQNSDTHQIFGCKCGSSNCRQLINPRWDWVKPAFRKEHEEEFPFFIRRQVGELEKLPKEQQDQQLLRWGMYSSAEMIAFTQRFLDEDSKALERLRAYRDLSPSVFKIVASLWLRHKGVTPQDLNKRIKELESDCNGFKRLKFEYIKLFVKCSPFNTGDDDQNEKVAKDHEDLVTQFALGWDATASEPTRDRVLALPV